MIDYLASRCFLFVIAIIGCSLSFSAFAVGNDKAPERKRSVDTIVLHSIGGPMCRNGKVVFTGSKGDSSKWKTFFEGSDGISIHYIVDRDGRVATSIDEDKVAWHARGINSRSIGIELTNNGDGVEDYPRPLLDSLRRLIIDLKLRHPEISNDRIVRHSDVDHSTFRCAGKQEKRKQDPGPKFPYRELIEGL